MPMLAQKSRQKIQNTIRTKDHVQSKKLEITRNTKLKKKNKLKLTEAANVSFLTEFTNRQF